jgi:transcriptional regulator NrdR family protein
MNPLIVKRNNSLELYNPQKIKRVVMAAGLSEEMATSLVSTIEKWLRSLKTEQLSSITLRDEVLNELKKVSTTAANLFAWYQKTKET